MLRRAENAEQRASEIIKKLQSTHGVAKITRSPQEQVDDEITPQVENLLSHRFEEHEVLELALDGALDNDDTDVTETSDSIDTSTATSADISARRIRRLKSIAKKLLLDKADTASLDQQIQELWTGPGNLSQKELEYMNSICRALSPFIPPKGVPNIIPLKLPLVQLSNIIQSVAGYGQFTRQICPVISPATIQRSTAGCCVHVRDDGIYSRKPQLHYSRSESTTDHFRYLGD